ncbi:hypothetical protein PCE1_002651 [Barthelona sp. PCE]
MEAQNLRSIFNDNSHVFREAPHPIVEVPYVETVFDIMVDMKRARALIIEDHLLIEGFSPDYSSAEAYKSLRLLPPSVLRGVLKRNRLNSAKIAARRSEEAHMTRLRSSSTINKALYTKEDRKYVFSPFSYIEFLRKLIHNHRELFLSILQRIICIQEECHNALQDASQITEEDMDSIANLFNKKIDESFNELQNCGFPPSSDYECLIFHRTCLFKLMSHRVDGFFSVFKSFNRDKDLVKRLKMDSLQFLTLFHLDVILFVDIEEEPLWKASMLELIRVSEFCSVLDIAFCFSNACKAILNVLTDNDIVAGADIFLPLLVCFLVKANPKNLVSSLDFVQRVGLMGHEETSYYLSSIDVALKFIDELNAEDFYHKKRRVVDPLGESPVRSTRRMINAHGKTVESTMLTLNTSEEYKQNKLLVFNALSQFTGTTEDKVTYLVELLGMTASNDKLRKAIK